MSEPAAGLPLAAVDAATQRELKDFLYREARLADTSDYEGWEALVTDDMHYWVPRGPADYDPAEGLSYINDNRARLGTRLRQLRSGSRWAQVPHSPMCRMLSNVEVLAADSPEGPYTVAANFVVYELAAQSTGTLHLWPGRATYRLRREQGELRMAQKIVELVTSRRPLPNLAFLL